MRRRILAASLILFAFPLSWAQEQKSQDEMPGMNQPAASDSQAPSPAAPSDAAKSDAVKSETTEPETTMPDAKTPAAGTPATPMNDSDMHNMVGMNNDGTAHAMRSMENRQMSMGPHMKMTTLRELKPGDREKADQVVAAAREAA